MSDKTPYCGSCEAVREPTDNGDCPECGTLVQWIGGVVSEGELRELVEEWRKTAAQKSIAIRGTYEICANELEELLADE